LLITSCCNAKAIDANDSWACPACIKLNQNEKENRILDSQKREIVEVSWNPTWEPEELKNTFESFKQSLRKFEEHITAPNFSQPAPDEHLNDLQKQGFSATQ
jgi:ubiquitin C-terminal hydrolase